MDDFSFPAVQTDHAPACDLPFPHFATSPLWFPPYRRSFSSAQESARVADSLTSSAFSDDEGARARASERFVRREEKMDMLWEDFNEDLCKSSCEWKKKEPRGAGGSIGRVSSAEFCTPKRAGCLLPHRKPSLGVMLKALKKLFLVPRNGSARGSPACENTVQ